MRHGTVMSKKHKVIVFDKETALQAIKDFKRGRNKEVLEWLEAVARVFPSSADREKERLKAMEGMKTSKQRRREKEVRSRKKERPRD